MDVHISGQWKFSADGRAVLIKRSGRRRVATRAARRMDLASMDTDDGLRIEVLGPVEAWVNGRQVAVGGQRPRALLAVLALMRGRVMTSERLIDALWGNAPPARA